MKYEKSKKVCIRTIDNEYFSEEKLNRELACSIIEGMNINDLKNIFDFSVEKDIYNEGVYKYSASLTLPDFNEDNIKLIEAYFSSEYNIVKHYNGFLIFAYNEQDLHSKKKKIDYGDTYGFFTIEYAYKQMLNCK